MSARKHVATYALYGMAGNRVGTGYLYDQKDIDKAEAHCERFGIRFHMRWRNEECRRQITGRDFQIILPGGKRI